MTWTERLYKVWRALIWTFDPADRGEAGKAITRNFWLHWFPPRMTRRSLSWSYSLWLGTISWMLFVILLFSGVVLMFLYVPSVERAYWSIKDLEYAVSWGWFLRNLHRWSAHMMVAAVFLHMLRVFYTGAYKNAESRTARREVNWIVGMILLVLTLLLSYTGYLLPWDQLAYWAIMIGVQIANSVPILGPKIKLVMAGGTELGQPTLIRFYTLHVIGLPLALIILFSYHMWRIRKDEGLAAVEQFHLARKGKISNLDKRGEEPVYSTPWAVRRILLVGLATLVWVMFLATFLSSPLEEPADLSWTPNPAKAPWYFLWLQELIAITTIRTPWFTINGGFVGGVLILGLIGFIVTIWPFFDRSPAKATGVWFHRTRTVHIILFSLMALFVVGLIFWAMYFRGPNWGIYWPWAWPEQPELI